jgi:hypothetical protein
MQEAPVKPASPKTSARPQFWRPPGGNYAVSIDHVMYVTTEDELLRNHPDQPGLNRYSLSFLFANGHLAKNYYSDQTLRDAHLKMFCDLAGVAQSEAAP